VNLIDRFERKLTYLRVSLTDRCNLRCVYCMPPEGVQLLPRDQILRISEYERLLSVFIKAGITKIRLTGGEPLLRRGVTSLVRSLSQHPSLKEIALTTNGIYLKPLVPELIAEGITSVNISLDSLNPHRYAAMTRGGDFYKVWDSIESCLSHGLKVKINVVAMQDLAFAEVDQFISLAMNNPIEIRFLEFMPLCGSASQSESGINFRLLKEKILANYPLVPVLKQNGDVASSYVLAAGKGRIGFIDSLSEPFCGDCNRLRLSSTGQLRLCLFSHAEVDLRTPLRAGATDADLLQIIQEGAFNKPKGHEEIRRFVINEDLPPIRSIGG